MANDIIPMTVRDNVEKAVMLLASGAASPQEARDAIAYADMFMRASRELMSRIKAAAIGWINVHGELVDGHTRYYVGTQTTTKCRDNAAAFMSLIDAIDGDIEQAARLFLASGAIKPGAAKKALTPERFAELFEVKRENELKTKLLTARVDGDELTEATE